MTFRKVILKSSIDTTKFSNSIFNINKKINLLDMTREQMHIFFLKIGETSFRADQVMKWIYHKYYDDFDLMTNISKSLRTKLKNLTKIWAPQISKEQRSIDGTVKWTINIDKQQIETVYIPENNRATLCISSQIGCPLNCTFCFTAQQGFNRNLFVSEIIGQIWRVNKIINLTKNINWHPITNVVMMGMGEPLLNLTNVVSAIKIMLDDLGFGLSKRRITISTSGVVPALDKLSNMIDVGLAISLHAPNDNIRSKIMPINRKYNINTFLSAVHRYLRMSNANPGGVTVEYVMLNKINDKVEHAYQLIDCLKTIPCKINLIPWNSFPNSSYISSSVTNIKIFADILINHGFLTTVRKIRGNDINAACGQLAGYVINRTKCTVYN